MFDFWYDYVKPEYGEKAILCFMDAGRFIVYIQADDIYWNIAEDVETRFDTSNYELDISFPKGKNKKVIELMIKQQVQQCFSLLKKQKRLF